MAVAHNDPWQSVEEFFALRDSDPEHRYEYIDGYIYMMSGGRPRHSAIGSNLNRIIGNHLLDSPCVAHDSDACVMISEKRYLCPDLTVTCDPRDSDENDEEDTLTMLRYPKLVMEVLSPSTQSFDRRAKFELYKDIPTIEEYVVIETTNPPEVLVYHREKNNFWTIRILTLDDEIELASIDLRFPVARIYDKTRFSLQKRG